MVGMLFAGHWSLVIGCWEFEGARLLTCGGALSQPNQTRGRERPCRSTEDGLRRHAPPPAASDSSCSRLSAPSRTS